MKRMKTCYAVSLFLSFLLFSGCAVLVTDRLPKNTPRGYVEFNRINVQKSWAVNNTTTMIYEWIDGKKVNMGELGKGSRKINRRIACTPGAHTFIVRYANGTKSEESDVDITIRENYIIPVNVVMTTTAEAPGQYGQIVHISSILKVEEAIRVKE
jgi:hypothetical protein